MMARTLWTATTLSRLALCATALFIPQLINAAEFEPPVRLKAGNEYIDTGKYIAHAGPLIADLNGDGKQDLAVGNFGGHFQIYFNTSIIAEPQYEDQGLLTVNGEPAKVPNW